LIAVKRITLAVVKRLDRPAPVFRDASEYRFGVLIPRVRGDELAHSSPLKILHVAAKYFGNSSYRRQVFQEIARYCRNEIKISPKSCRRSSLFGPIQNASQ
jgi:hypothetical protein